MFKKKKNTIKIDKFNYIFDFSNNKITIFCKLNTITLSIRISLLNAVKNKILKV